MISAKIMLELKGLGRDDFSKKVIPRWKRVLESNCGWGLFACSGRVW